jgi:U3 small nucleolar RNA-associated protein 12
LNREEPNLDPEGGTAQPAETSEVSKQTTETLMAGERIMEALDLADKELATMEEYEQAKLSDLQLQPPPRNPILAAYDVSPERYVLQVVEKVHSTSLQDALLVLPFTKVISLMNYLNIWAQNVSVTY